MANNNASPMTANASAANNGSSNAPGHLQERLDGLELRLKSALAEREDKQNQIKEGQLELSKLFQAAPSRPQENLAEIDARINKLEVERVRVSLPLSQEKMILKQIHKLQRQKQKVREYVVQEQAIQTKKTAVTELRDRLRHCNQQITSLRVEIGPVSLANRLGCQVEELLGRAVEIPADKVGQIIGKKGRNLKLMSSTVQVDVTDDKTDDRARQVRIVGALSSLDAAALDMDKVIQQKEIKLEGIKKILLEYMTSKGITFLQDIRVCHPDIRVDAHRTNGITCRGVPSDIEAFRQDLLSTSLTQSKLQVSSREASLVVGKKGATVESIVTLHQTAIQVDRHDEETTTILVMGPAGHVESAVREIQELLAANREIEKQVPTDRNVKNALLLENGKGIQALFQKVNDADKTAGYIAVNLSGDDAIVVRGKARVLDSAAEVVEAEVRRLQQMVVSVSVDPAAIPVFIGKGGAGVKTLRGDDSVSLEFDRLTGDIVLSGLEAAPIAAVRARVQALADQQLVERIRTPQYKNIIGDFLRTQAKTLNAMVFLKLDDERQEIVLRGSREKLDEAQTIVQEYLAQNFTQELEVTNEDLQALLTGGKTSKIVELSNENGVKLNSFRDRQVIVARGPQEAVETALAKLKQFLYGGEGISLVKLTIDPKVMGMIIGRQGKTKMELEQKHGVSILLHRNEHVLALRGPDEAVEACRAEIRKMIVTARITYQMDLTAKQHQQLETTKAHRRALQNIPVQLTMTSDAVSLRGTRENVNDAVAALKEALGQPYQIGYYLEGSLFRRVKEAWKDPANLQRIEKNTKAKVQITSDAILFQGKRANVTKAKTEVSRYLSFLFGEQFAAVDVNPLLVTSLAKSQKVTAAMAETDCQMILDRDLHSVLIFGSDGPKVRQAHQIMKAKVESEDKLMFIMNLAEGEEWIVSSLLGKNGSNIKKLRKELQCKMEVRDRVITINHPDNIELVEAAKTRVQEIVQKARDECAVVVIPQQHLASFVGRAGSHITQLSDEHQVEMQLSKKKTPATVRITGKADAIPAAVEAIQRWLAEREGKFQQEQAFVTAELRRDQVPTVIGTRGAVVQRVQTKFRVKIDIDRKTSVVTVRGAQRVAALECMKAIADGEDPAEVLGAAATVGTDNDKPDAKPKPAPVKAAPAAATPETAKPMQATDFPSLGGGESNAASTSSGVAASKITWANVIKPMTTNSEEEEILFDDQPNNDDDEDEPVVAKEETTALTRDTSSSSSAPFLGDVDEALLP